MAGPLSAPVLLVAVTAFLGLGHGFPGILDSSVTLPANKKVQIVGGTAADIKDFGHQVSWQPGGEHRCGGSLISPEWIVTAAHCFGGPGGKDALLNSSVVAGTSVLHSKAHKGQATHVVELHPHPHFDATNFTNDIALLKVSPPFVNETGVRAIPIIAAGGPPLVNDTVIVTGWGLLNEFAYRASLLLQKVKVVVRDMDDCRKKYSEIISLHDTVMCANAPGKDACSGDSGGPLIFRGADDKDYLVGVVSSGQGCARKEFPGIYTDLRNLQMRSFITKITGIQL